MYNSPSTLGNALVGDNSDVSRGDGVSSIEMLRIRRACGVLLAEEAYNSEQAAADRRPKSTPNAQRGRSRSRRGKNTDGALFVPSRLSASPYNTSLSNSRSRRQSPSPYDALPSVLGEDPSERSTGRTGKRPRTTPHQKRGEESLGDLKPPSHSEDSVLGNQEALREARVTAEANHMAFMKTNVAEMRDTLQAVTGMLLERGIIDQVQASSSTSTLERPSTSPAQVSLAPPSKQAGSTIHVIEDATVPTQFGLNQDQLVMLKFIRGEKNKDER